MIACVFCPVFANVFPDNLLINLLEGILNLVLNGDQVDITSPAITDVLGSLADNFDILDHGDFDVRAFLSNLLDAVSESAAEEFGTTGSTLLCIIEVIEREIDSSVLDDVLLKLQKIREAITSLTDLWTNRMNRVTGLRVR